MRARDQGGAGGYVVVIGGHRAPTGRRKRIQGPCPRGGHLHKTLAEVPDAVVVAVGGDDVDVPLPVNSRTAPRLPDRSGIAIRCRHVDAKLAAQIRGVVTQHPAVVRRLVAMEIEGAGYGDVGIKQAIEGGYIPGPRLFVSTRAISTTGGYPLEGYAPEIEVPKGVQIIDGPVEARKAAREQLDHGADWIKVYMTHRSWVGKNGELVSQPTLTVEELRAIVDETHGWGKKVACH